MIYLYAVVDDPAVLLADLRGHAGTELVSVAARPDLAAVGSEHEELRLTDSSAAMWVHNKVVDGLMARCAVAPARFGSTVDDTRLLAELLRHQQSALLDTLNRVRGKVELAVRVSIDLDEAHPRAGDPPSSPGRGYLSQVRLRRAHPTLRLLDASLGSRSTGSVTRFRSPTTMDAAYLVDRDDVDNFTAAVSRLATTYTEATLTLTGPWGPFSFVDGEVLSVG